MAYAELVDGEIRVKTHWTEKDLAAAVPGLNHSSKLEAWHGPLSWATCIILSQIFNGRLELGPSLLWWGNETKRWVDAAMYWRDRTDSADLCTPDSDDPFCRLYSYQRTGVNFLGLIPDGALLADEMGCGKTPQVLTALNSPHVQTLPALVICPNSVKGQWAEEAAIWCPNAHPYVIGGGAVGRRKQLDAARDDPNALIIINFEAVKLHSRLAPYGSVRLIRCVECGGPDEKVTSARCHKHPKELNEIPFLTVVVDEAHRMKEPSSQQTRACWAVMHQETVTKRWALTGTPIANHVGDLWSIMHGVARNDFPTKTEFIERFALLAWNSSAGLDIVGVNPDRRSEFDTIVKPRTRRMLKSIVLPHLPSKIRMIREAPLIPKQRKAYEEMQNEMVTILDDGDMVISKTNLTKATRLLQFSSSYATIEVIPKDDGSSEQVVRLSEPSPKLDVLMEVLEELGDRQVVICALSRQLIELAAQRLDRCKPEPISYRMLTGAVPDFQRPVNIREFQEGKARCMLFTIQAGGVGVNLTAADTIVFLQRSWSMIENKQATDRVHRIGSERHESITVIDIVAPDTIEVDQIRRLREKEDRLDEIVRDRERLTAMGLDCDQLLEDALNEYLL